MAGTNLRLLLDHPHRSVPTYDVFVAPHHCRSALLALHNVV